VRSSEAKFKKKFGTVGLTTYCLEHSRCIWVSMTAFTTKMVLSRRALYSRNQTLYMQLTWSTNYLQWFYLNFYDLYWNNVKLQRPPTNIKWYLKYLSIRALFKRTERNCKRVLFDSNVSIILPILKFARTTQLGRQRDDPLREAHKVDLKIKTYAVLSPQANYTDRATAACRRS
jgi:hypothetical protein